MGIIADLHGYILDKALTEELIRRGYFNEEMLNHIITKGYLDKNMKTLLLEKGITPPSDIVASSSEQLTELSNDEVEKYGVEANK